MIDGVFVINPIAHAYKLDAAFFWTPNRMSERGKQALEARRRATIALIDLKPRQWKELAHARD